MTAPRLRSRAVVGHTLPFVASPLPTLDTLADFASGLEWQERALCAQADPERFFPERGDNTLDAKRVCMACEVRTECLNYALENDEQWGVWGGLSDRQRRALKREQRKEAA